MTVHKSGALAPTTSDLQITHQGVQVMLKCIQWEGGLPLIALCEKRGAAWETFAVLWEFSDGEIATINSNGIMGWIKNTLLPLINACLAERFKASAAPVVQATPGTFEEVDALLSAMLVWQPQPDGTLRMAVK